LTNSAETWSSGLRAGSSTVPKFARGILIVRFERRCAMRLRPINPCVFGSVLSATRVFSMVPSARNTLPFGGTSMGTGPGSVCECAQTRVMRRP